MTRPRGAPPGASFTHILDTVGDGTGTKNANGDYSSTPGTFILKPPPDRVFGVHQMLVFVRDTAIKSDGYGAIVGGLANGIIVQIVNDNEVMDDLTNGTPVKTTAGWARFCEEVIAPEWDPGSAPKFMGGRWALATDEATHITIRGNNYNRARNNERLQVTLSDDLTGLLEHYFVAKGELIR
jgi:hypothetical protein